MSISAQFLPQIISSLPVPFIKFEGSTSEHLGQLFVTPKMIANKIKKMKDNKSPGYYTTNTTYKEFFKQIRTQLAKLFHL